MDTGAIRTYVLERLLRPGSSPPGDDDPLFSSGRIDSFGVLELIAFLEDRYGIVIDTTKHHILDFDTLRKIAAVVAKEQPAEGAPR